MCEFPICIFIEGFEPYLMVAGVGGLSYYLCICKIDLPQAQIITERSIWRDLLISDFGMKAFQRREKNMGMEGSAIQSKWTNNGADHRCPVLLVLPIYVFGWYDDMRELSNIAALGNTGDGTSVMVVVVEAAIG